MEIEWLEDVSPADWIAPRLHPSFSDTGSVIPEGFEAYARLFHPVESWHPYQTPRRWGEIAQENGRVVHPEMQFHMIARPPGAPVPEGYDRNYGGGRSPSWGSLPTRERGVLIELLRPATTTPDACWFCVWEGHGGLDDRGVTARVELPARKYLLYRGPIEMALAGLPGAGPGRGHVYFRKVPEGLFGRLRFEIGARSRRQEELPELPQLEESPNLWWPEDRAWFVATEIDYAWTYVGGTRELVDALIGDPRLEALPALLTDKPFYDSDWINGGDAD